MFDLHLLQPRVRNTRPAKFTLGFLIATMMLFTGGCEERQSASAANAIENAEQNLEEQRSYPEPPPPMTSDTQILSGGWLLTGDGSEPLFDSIVVIQKGAIVGVGKRGMVDVPADSIGVDASGKWILPGTTTQLSAAFGKRQHDAPTQFASAELPAIGVGRTADLVLLNSNPLTDPQALKDVHAIIARGEVEVLSADPS